MKGIIAFLRGQLYATIVNNRSSIAASLRARMLATKCHLDTGVFVTNPANLHAHALAALYHGTYILNDHGTFEIGRESHLGARCFVNAQEGAVKVGDNVAIGPQTQIFSFSNHYAAGKLVTDCRITEDVAIGNNVFIGANSTILPGTLIADNVVIGAGSVVRGEIAANGIYAGNPKPVSEERLVWRRLTIRF